MCTEAWNKNQRVVAKCPTWMEARGGNSYNSKVHWGMNLVLFEALCISIASRWTGVFHYFVSFWYFNLHAMRPSPKILWFAQICISMYMNRLISLCICSDRYDIICICIMKSQRVEWIFIMKKGKSRCWNQHVQHIIFSSSHDYLLAEMLTHMLTFLVPCIVAISAPLPLLPCFFFDYLLNVAA